MPISVACDACGRDYSVRDDAAGCKFRCSDCGRILEVPESPLTTAVGKPDPLETAAADEAWERSPPSRSRPGEGAPPSSRLAKASLVIGGIVWGIALIGFVALMVLGFALAGEMERGQPLDDSPGLIALALAVLGAGCLSYVLSLVGGVLGLAALAQPTATKGAAVVGVVLNGLFFVAASGLFVLLLLAGAQ
jgi:hypothetical protein